ncbi:UDP-GlcNAc:betaGal beta-1,3-N-acetylglucosaminyltransferase 8 [Discoglossus pictus]
MVRCRKFTTSAGALLTLMAIKIYLDLTYEEPPTPPPTVFGTEPPGDPLPFLEPFHGQQELSLLALHSLAQGLRKLVVKSNALWNEEELKLLDTHGVRSWTCTRTSLTDSKAFSEPLENFILYGGCRNHKLLIDQLDKCPANKTFLLLAIKSSPNNFAQRQAVRNTWGAEGNYGGHFVRLVFLLGRSIGPDLSTLLFHEHTLFQDLLQWDFEDTFFNLTLKDQLFLDWVTRRCPDTRFILKGDDDVFARTSDIVKYLSLLSESRSRALYMGHVVKSARPYRDTRSKYYIPSTYYVGWYPPYAGGGGYVFTGALAPWLYLVSHFVAPFPIDDVYTGMCFKALGINPTGNPRFRTFEVPGDHKVKGCLESSLLLVHKRSPQDMMKMWREQKREEQC